MLISRLHRVRLQAILLALVLSGGMIFVASPEARAECWTESYIDDAGVLQTHRVCDGSSGDNDPGDGDNGLPCDLEADPGYDEFCDGEAACWGNDPAAVQKPSELKGVPKPNPDAHVAYKSCKRPDGSTYDQWYWSTKSELSLGERALQAFNSLKTPQFQLEFNPPERTYVTLETWWWADGPSNGEIESPPALGVTAVGTPDRIEVRPGDGSPPLTCPWTTAKSDACTYTYERASVNGAATVDGSPAYPAEARLVYNIHYELNNQPIELQGVPTSLSSPWESRGVPVAELQGIVVE